MRVTPRYGKILFREGNAAPAARTSPHGTDRRPRLGSGTKAPTPGRTARPPERRSRGKTGGTTKPTNPAPRRGKP